VFSDIKLILEFIPLFQRSGGRHRLTSDMLHTNSCGAC